MMESRVIVLLLAAIVGATDANPFLFYPAHMLPSAETTFNFTFTGSMNTMRVSGVYTLQAVTDERTKVIIGYRNWQSYDGDFKALFYGVSYLNGSYLQALIDPHTQECTGVFTELMNCTVWSNTQIVRWDSHCSIVRVDSPIVGDMLNTVRTSPSDLKRPISYIGIVSISGIPEKATITYQFHSQIEQKSFPFVKCYF